MENRVNTERIKAVITLVVVCVANVANLYGVYIDADAVVQLALMVVTAIATVYAWWKNNNVTREAVAAQELLDKLKRDGRGKHRAEQE